MSVRNTAEVPPAWDDAWQVAWDARATRGSGSADASATASGNTSGTDPAARVPVRVVRIDKGGITVSARPHDERLVVAAKSVRRVVVGDVCALDAEAGRIEEILPRRTVFERRSPGADRSDVAITAKALAANMDIVLVLQGLDAGVNTARLAREMVLAWESGAQPVVVLTKADTVSAERAEEGRAAAQRFAPGVPVVCVASRVGQDRSSSQLGELRPHLPRGSVAVLLGSSGAGKSTLANALAGHPVQLTAEVREGDRRGRHTTTAGQMLPLADNTWLIDTPGIRGVGLWKCDEGLERAFCDLAPFAEACRFVDCTHRSEPGCGVTAAVERGDVGADRLDVWHGLVEEIEQLEAEMEMRERDLERQANQRSRHRAESQRGRPRT